ncbi:MAG: SGNH/GDSL hydrolase family protein [Coprococcus sp.]
MNIKKYILPAAVLLIFIMLIIAIPKLASEDSGTNLNEGISHLKTLEGKDVSAIEQEIKQNKKDARAEALALALEDGSVSLWAQFNDSAIYGDSRTVGFYTYDLLDESRVLAAGGLTIAGIPDYIDQMKMLNPSCLFLCTGLNDVSIGLWPTPEDYVTSYEEVMQTLMKALPDTEIYVNSIFPAQDPAFEQSTKWYKIPDYNEALKAWCKENGYHYIDNTAVFEAHSDLYDIDGIHFQKDFYQYWATNMLIEAAKQ